MRLNTRFIIIIALAGLFLGAGAAALANAESSQQHNHETAFSVFTLIKTLGICAMVSLLVTFLSGLFRTRLGRRFLPFHKLSARLTVMLALSHGIAVMIVF